MLRAERAWTPWSSQSRPEDEDGDEDLARSSAAPWSFALDLGDLDVAEQAEGHQRGAERRRGEQPCFEPSAPGRHGRRSLALRMRMEMRILRGHRQLRGHSPWILGILTSPSRPRVTSVVPSDAAVNSNASSLARLDDLLVSVARGWACGWG